MSAKRFTYIVSCDLFHKLMFESSRVGWGKGFLKPNLPRTPLSSSPPPDGRGQGKEGIELLWRARPPPTSRSCLARPDLEAGGLHPTPRSSRWEGGWFFPGHWRTLSIPSHLFRFHPGSRLSGGRQGHSNPPTTREDVAGRGGGACCPFPAPKICPGFFSTPGDPSHPGEEKRTDKWFQACLFTVN